MNFCFRNRILLCQILLLSIFSVGIGCSAKELTGNQNDQCLAVLSIPDNLGRFKRLRQLQISNEDKFYSCLIQDVEKLMPIVYTPVVGEACENYGKVIDGVQQGLTLRITEANLMEQRLTEWKQHHPDIKAIVVTDGGRILGLGDLGANGMGIPVGKMALYSALGGVHPNYCLPVTLDVGTDNEKFLKDVDGLYVGIKERRRRGEGYYNFVEKFMTTVTKVYGQHTLIQFEDFANENAFKLLAKYQGRYTMFNDDIQGTAAVTLAGLLAAERAGGRPLKDSIVLFAGAGEAGVGIAKLIFNYLVRSGMSVKDARKKIWMKRSDKLMMAGDPPDENAERGFFRQSLPDGVPADANVSNLGEIIKWLKPNILIGVTSQTGLFTSKVLWEMAKQNPNQKPIIFALSNPSEKSECTAEEAYINTEGRVLFASGSPFPAVTLNGQTFHPGQCNNAYIFPGVALAVTAVQMTSVPEEVFLIAAEALANVCTLQTDLDQGSLFPKLTRLRDCSVHIATEIAKYAFKNGLSMVNPVPSDVKTFIQEHQYRPTGL